MASFWDSFGPGMVQFGGNYFLQDRAAKEAEERLKRAQGPLYNQTMDAAGKSLALASSFDPAKHAKERFAAQDALMAPGREADQQKLMRELQAKGMLGAASFSPVAGTVATPGVPMNPQMAALLAAQEGAKSKAAYDSMQEGEQYLNDLLRRSTALQATAQNARATGQRAMGGIPTRPSAVDMLVRGGMNVLKDKDARDMVGGLFGRGMDWLRGSIPTTAWASNYSIPTTAWASNYDAMSGLWE